MNSYNFAILGITLVLLLDTCMLHMCWIRERMCQIEKMDGT